MNIYRRFESAVPNSRGVHPGIFAMANGLAGAGLLAPVDLNWWRDANDRASQSYPDPSSVQPECFDADVNPGARSWFKESAVDLIGMAHTYLSLLDRYQVPWVELRTSSPGRITYEDDVQVVAAPLCYPEDWMLNS